MKNDPKNEIVKMTVGQYLRAVAEDGIQVWRAVKMDGGHGHYIFFKQEDLVALGEATQVGVYGHPLSAGHTVWVDGELQEGHPMMGSQSPLRLEAINGFVARTEEELDQQDKLGLSTWMVEVPGGHWPAGYDLEEGAAAVAEGVRVESTHHFARLEDGRVVGLTGVDYPGCIRANKRALTKEERDAVSKTEIRSYCEGIHSVDLALLEGKVVAGYKPGALYSMPPSKVVSLA